MFDDRPVVLGLPAEVIVPVAAIVGSVVGYAWLRRVTGIEPDVRSFRATDPPRRWVDPLLRLLAVIAAVGALLLIVILASRSI